jgi:hypothetical protein
MELRIGDTCGPTSYLRIGGAISILDALGWWWLYDSSTRLAGGNPFEYTMDISLLYVLFLWLNLVETLTDPQFVNFESEKYLVNEDFMHHFDTETGLSS